MDKPDRARIWRIALIGLLLAFSVMQCKHFQSALPSWWHGVYGERSSSSRE